MKSKSKREVIGARTFLLILIGLVWPLTNLAKTDAAESWLTSGDQSARLQKQPVKLNFDSPKNDNPVITVDETQSFQTIDGFGYTLTGGSAQVINRLRPEDSSKLLRELFGPDENSISISYLRVSLGASDLNDHVFSYDDVAAGETDLQLLHFDFGPDKTDVIPLLKEILRINPKLKILASPWSAPVWMKDNRSSKGGSLEPKYYEVYAQYFVRYIREMERVGIKIDALTPQNEPLHPGNNPSMLMTARQQSDFIKNNLGPAFRKAGIKTKIIIYDHNCDKPEYPIEILNDPQAAAFIDGSAFHLYRGNIGALTTVHNAHPDKNLYFTEQYTPSNGDFGNNLKWHLKNVIIGSMRNWSRTALEWNLANDAAFKPHTEGGCTTCKGALTIENDQISRNVGYYIIAHASKFVPPGSVRIGSNMTGDLHNVAFKTPRRQWVLIVENDGQSAAAFNIKFKNKWLTASLAAGAVATYRW